MLEDIRYYLQTKAGPISSTGAHRCGAFVQTSYEKREGIADINYAFEGGLADEFIADPTLYPILSQTALAYYNGINIRPVLLTPRSRGWIFLNDTDPVYGPPLIYPNTFTAYPDLESYVEGMQIAASLFNTKIFRKWGIRILDTPVPACRQYRFGTNEYWGCVAMEYTATLFHPGGTCKMGPKSDPGAVVDPRLRIYGIKNMRVIDASIMPVVAKGNTNAPTIMVGEKGSDMIKEDWLGSL